MKVCCLLIRNPNAILCSAVVFVCVLRFPLPLPLSDHFLVVVAAAAVVFWIAIAIAKSYSSCTWREERVGNDLDSGRVDIIVDAKGMLPVRVLHDCHVVCVSRLPLPLLDRVLVDLVALGGKDVLAMILIADVLTLLMLMMDCWGAKQSNTS